MESIGNRVRRLRQTRQWTQAQLGQLAMIAQSAISDIERGRRPTATEVGRLAKVFEVDPKAFLTDASLTAEV